MQNPVVTERKHNTLSKMQKLNMDFLYLFEVEKSLAAPSNSEYKEEQTYVSFSGNGLSYHAQ